MQPLRPLFSLRAARRLARRGFTLIELIVCIGLVTVIGLILIGILAQSSAMISQGTLMLEFHQKTRSAIDRMTPYVMTAVSRSTGSAFITPAKRTSSNQIFDDTIRFTTTEDFLDPNYVPNPSAPYNSLSAPVYTYEFALVRENPSDHSSLGQLVLRKVEAGVPVSNPVPKIIGHRIQNFKVLRLTADTIEVQIDVSGRRKGPQGNQVFVLETERAIIPVPADTYNY